MGEEPDQNSATAGQITIVEDGSPLGLPFGPLSQIDHQGSIRLPPSEIDGKSLIIFHLFLNEILLRYASYLNLSAYTSYITQFAYVALLNALADVMEFDGTQESQ